MSYQVIARKYRPQSFREIVGQQHVTETLSNAIRQNRVAHAYIFSGARGVGKTTAARILAKALNCAKGPTADVCNECDSCREISAGTSLDVIEIDAASNRGIDQIRELREMVRYAPAASRKKVVILDEAHMLTSEASNALLKTLEEPPDNVVFVMATTEPDNLADTIRSRSQHFHFRALSFGEITERLGEIVGKEGLQAEAGALAVMSRAAEGSLRDALSLLEQARAYCGETLGDAQVRELLGVVPEEALDRLVTAVGAGSAEGVLNLVHALLAEGRNLQHFCREAIRYFRDLLVARVSGADSELIAAIPEHRPKLAKAAAMFSEEDLTRFFQILLTTDDDLRRKPDPRLHLEMGLLRLVNAARLAPLEEVLAELTSGGSAAANARASSVKASSAAEQRAPMQSTTHGTPGVASFPSASGKTAMGAAAGGPASGMPVAKADTLVSRATAANHPVARPAAPIAAPASSASTSVIARCVQQFDGIEAAQVEAIKSAILGQQKFLGELVEHVCRWELEGGEMRLYFPTERRALAELLQARDPMEKLRTITSKVVGQPLRVCVKLETVQAPRAAGRVDAGAAELRAQFEQDPIVRAMLQRFGGRLSEIKRRQED
ncbi:MAG TPA: DNA polymerase III subunit gamma/tau [Candidatus Dormibacteraeota bacterium]|nr:DNA polymerase III subunit gamma/tau [Candidatus Dormibacteraeota bacterium]